MSRFECDQCHKSFKRKGDLNRHGRLHDPAAAKFACGFCNRSFFRKDKLNVKIPLFIYSKLIMGIGTCSRERLWTTQRILKSLRFAPSVAW